MCVLGRGERDVRELGKNHFLSDVALTYIPGGGLLTGFALMSDPMGLSHSVPAVAEQCRSHKPQHKQVTEACADAVVDEAACVWLSFRWWREPSFLRDELICCVSEGPLCKWCVLHWALRNVHATP